MNPQILFYTEDDGSVRMTIPNTWISWRNVMNNTDPRSFLHDDYRHLLDYPGVSFQPHYLQLKFENESIAVQFKLAHL